MAEYKEQTVAGKMWVRANKICIENTRNATPTISISEEQVFCVESSTSLTTPSGTMSFLFDPEETINVYDPTTNSIVEGKTITGREVYNAVYSYYMTKAKQRDDAQGE